MTLGIINILSGIATSDKFLGPNNPIQRVYAFLGERFFPDAHIVGITGNLSVNILNFVRDFFNVPIPYQLNFNLSGLLGIEILMDISSAQLAVFKTVGEVAELGYTVWTNPDSPKISFQEFDIYFENIFFQNISSILNGRSCTYFNRRQGMLCMTNCAKSSD